MNYLSNITRPQGDPKVLQSGQSSLGAADQLGRALGWFSIGLGVLQLVAPRRITRTLGMDGHETLVRSYGAREIASGVLSLSLEKDKGLWSRVAGDGLDVVTLLTALRPENPKRGNVGLALMMVLGITALDVFGAAATTARHSRSNTPVRNYRDRSGFPGGLEKARGAARDVRQTPAIKEAESFVHSAG